MMRTFCLVLFILPLVVFGQDSTPSAGQYVQDSLHILRPKLIRPQFKFDNRITFNQGQALSITGFDLGVLLNEKLRLTFGYCTMKEHLKVYDHVKENETFGRLIQLKYGSINSEFIYYNKRFISFGMPLEIGAGTNTFQYVDLSTNNVYGTNSGALIFVNFGMSATYKPMRFLGLKGIVGYRKVMYNQVKDFNFDGFFTSIGVNIDIHAIITDIRMYRLMKRYGRGNNIANAVDIITM